jgi:hypothetical protein
VEAMPKHKQAGHTTVLTKYAQTPKKRLQCRSHPNMPFGIQCHRCGAARHSGLSLQVQNRADSELVALGTKQRVPLRTSMAIRRQLAA